MKYLPSMIVAGSLLLAVVVPAFAGDKKMVVKNNAHITNVSVAVANSGLNSASGHDAEVKTGDATAFSDATVNCVNTTGVAPGTDKVKLTNHANLLNVSASVANSGLNSASGHDAEVKTGDAYAGASAKVKNVNSTF